MRTPHDSNLLQPFFSFGLESSILFVFALLAQPAPEVLTVFLVPKGHVAIAFSSFVLLQQCKRTVPVTLAAPNDTDILQQFLFLRFELSGFLALALVVQPHSEIETIFFVVEWNIAVALSCLVLEQEGVHIVPSLTLNIPNHAELGEPFFQIGIQSPSNIRLNLALIVQPNSETFPVFFVFLWNIAVALSFFVLHQESKHVLPFPTLDVPDHSELGEFSFLVPIQLSVRSALSLIVQPHPEIVSAFLVFLRNVAVARPFLVTHEVRVHVFPDIPNESEFLQLPFLVVGEGIVLVQGSLSIYPSPQFRIGFVGPRNQRRIGLRLVGSEALVHFVP
mmetsp:Transcript_29310/g.79332  ORF Transcript_29310/g.79332 Transcript_29310/m.79332 type:complete len:334 (+) Transcript_29310:301-1302(+)